jgi:hypothetical protein
MRSTLTSGIAIMVGLVSAGCGGSSGSPAPSAPSTTLHVGPTAGNYPTNPTLVGVTIFGVVSETTPAGPVPIEGVTVYCDSCGTVGHTSAYTDANGYYSFSGDLSQDGGVWVQEGFTNPLIVRKEGYDDPTGLPPRTWPGSPLLGWREVTINGDTRFDIELVRR